MSGWIHVLLDEGNTTAPAESRGAERDGGHGEEREQEVIHQSGSRGRIHQGRMIYKTKSCAHESERRLITKTWGLLIIFGTLSCSSVFSGSKWCVWCGVVGGGGG